MNQNNAHQDEVDVHHDSNLHIPIQSGPFVTISDEDDANEIRRRELTLPDFLSVDDKQDILDAHNAARNDVSAGIFESIYEASGFLPPATDMEELIWVCHIQPNFYIVHKPSFFSLVCFHCLSS